MKLYINQFSISRKILGSLKLKKIALGGYRFLSVENSILRSLTVFQVSKTAYCAAS